MAAGVNVFCINLPHETGRRDRMRAQADAARLDLVFVPAVHGSELSEPFAAYGCGASRARVAKRIMPRNEIACFFSHRRALQRFLASDAAYGLVLEDDVAIDPARRWQALDRLDWIDDRLPAAMGHSAPGGPPTIRCGGHSIAGTTSPSAAASKCISGAQALRYNREGAERVLARTDRFWLPFDIQLGRNWESGLRILEITPFPVALTQLPSTIGHEGKPSWPQPTLGAKLAHLRWQVGGELARRAMVLGQCP